MESLSKALTDLSLPGIAALVFASLIGAAGVGVLLGRYRTRRLRLSARQEDNLRSQQNYLVSGTLLFLGLLMGFTFSVALERYEQRRMLVVTEANAIGTAYLRAQLLDEPHRTRLSNLLSAYTDNRIELGAAERPAGTALLDKNDRLLVDIWAAVSAARESAQNHGISVSILQTFNEVIDLDTERKVARLAHVPDAVLLTLFIFMLVTATLLGSELTGTPQRLTAVALFAVITLSTCIIVDLNRPTSGAIRESQEPLIMLQQSLRTNRSAFDKYK